ncbi:MAG: DEAD/DEAH box helicase [Muribaculaceae bacterium]|nr:DEAD/DEAH box helicase [Muribaculaceae bacterium]
MTSDKILENLSASIGVNNLNDMQQVTLTTARSECGDIMLYSPTGSGKTLAFLLPCIEMINEVQEEIQVIIIVPSRELAIQIKDVTRAISPSCINVTCCYGGHNFLDEARALQSLPHIVIATPGRLLDHINRGTISLAHVRIMVLDEFDKSLELGFASEMASIIEHVPQECRNILTSATHIEQMPPFVKLNNPIFLDFCNNGALVTSTRLAMWQVRVKSENSRLDALLKLLMSLADERTIIFTNYRDTAHDVFTHLLKHNIPAVLYHGALNQIDREKAVALFNNGSAIVMVATDLASRGLDITDVKHIIHYQPPLSEEVFIHRNGRTARVNECGNVYVMRTPHDDTLPSFMPSLQDYECKENRNTKKTSITTIFISAGRKEKISRGDIVGFILAGTHAISPGEIGKIDIFDHYSLVAVPSDATSAIIKDLLPLKLKKQKVKLSIAKPVRY